jgi:hypothetical protein
MSWVLKESSGNCLLGRSKQTENIRGRKIGKTTVSIFIYLIVIYFIVNGFKLTGSNHKIKK